MDSTDAREDLDSASQRLAKEIASEIVLSKNPEKVLRKWRTIFKISQKRLAQELGIMSSVISDYESGRRKSPGINIIKRYVNTVLKIDSDKGGEVIRSFAREDTPKVTLTAIIDIKEFDKDIGTEEFCSIIKADLLTKGEDRKVWGYTVIDSVKAITEASFQDLIKLYGRTTQRALIFTKVTTGRSPMVAIKIANLKPSLVVLHGLDEVDEIAKRIAEVENIPLALCRLEKVEDIVAKLKTMEA